MPSADQVLHPQLLPPVYKKAMVTPQAVLLYLAPISMSAYRITPQTFPTALGSPFQSVSASPRHVRIVSRIEENSDIAPPDFSSPVEHETARKRHKGGKKTDEGVWNKSDDEIISSLAHTQCFQRYNRSPHAQPWIERDGHPMYMITTLSAYTGITEQRFSTTTSSASTAKAAMVCKSENSPRPRKAPRTLPRPRNNATSCVEPLMLGLHPSRALWVRTPKQGTAPSLPCGVQHQTVRCSWSTISTTARRWRCSALEPSFHQREQSLKT
jgi:hypothetical protein